MIIAVDFDNTLALGNTSHITTMEPNRPLIARLQAIRDQADEIVIVTARGAKGGLSTKMKRKIYDAPLREWLTKYAVPFDRISYKKEYANLYIDDQTITPDASFFGQSSAFTGNKIIFTEQTVTKFCPSALFEFEWYKRARLLGFNVPDVLFSNDECIITRRLYDVSKPRAAQFIDILEAFKKIPGDEDFKTYLDNIPAVNGTTGKTMDCVARLPNMAHSSTFFHGDLSTTNVLIGYKIHLIDPNSKHVFGSYLTDAGKAAFSLIAYEAQFDEAQKIVDRFGPNVWYFAVAEGLRVCKYQPKYVSIVNNIADLI